MVTICYMAAPNVLKIFGRIGKWDVSARCFHFPFSALGDDIEDNGNK